VWHSRCFLHLACQLPTEFKLHQCAYMTEG
jgi:hypothetical protein